MLLNLRPKRLSHSFSVVGIMELEKICRIVNQNLYMTYFFSALCTSSLIGKPSFKSALIAKCLDFFLKHLNCLFCSFFRVMIMYHMRAYLCPSFTATSLSYIRTSAPVTRATLLSRSIKYLKLLIMQTESEIKIGFTMGDPNGIGPEVLIRACIPFIPLMNGTFDFW